MEGVKKNRMGTEPILQLIIKMSIPAMFSMLVQALYNIVDSIFVAQICDEALTAVSLAFPIQVLLIAVAVGTGIGVNSLISRRLGEGKQDEADNAAKHGIVLGFISWIPFLIFGLFFTSMFFRVFTSNQNIINLGVEYTSYVSIFSFGVLVQCIIERILQATGNMIYPMIFQIIGAITNAILDPILIFGLLGFPKMGILGAAVATVVAQILSMLYSFYVLIKKDHEIDVHFKGFRFSGRVTKEIYAVGLPSVILQSMSAVMVVAMNNILIAFSEVAVAVMGVYFKFQSFIFMPVFGLTNGIMPIMGYNFGAGNKKRLTSTIKISCFISAMIMFLGTLIFIFFGKNLLMIFNASDDMINIGVKALRIISFSFLPASIGIVISTFFQATNHGVSSLIMSFLRQLVGIIPIAYFLSRFGLDYVWFAFPLSELLSIFAAFIMFIYIYKKQIQNLKLAYNE